MNKKAQSGLVGLVTTLVVVGILVIIGVLVYNKVSGSIDQTEFTAEANTTVSNVTSTFFDSIDLTTVALIVLAASVIIGILLTAFARGRN